MANKKKKLGLDKIVCCFIYVYPRFRYFANFVLFRSRSFSRAAEGVPILLLKKIRFEAKLSKTETVLLRFTSASRNHKNFSLFIAKKAFCYGSFALNKSFASVVSLYKSFASKK